MSSPIEDLVAEAKEAGVTDAYGFAEWLVDERQHFGRSGSMTASETESAWTEAKGWWDLGNKA